MRLYSTNNTSNFVSLKKAVLKGLPEDNGLYMPETIPVLPNSFIENLSKFTFQEIAFTVAQYLIGDNIPKNELKDIVEDAINFPAPVISLDNNTHILELFHGPSLAFKDFGARFMAQLMSYFNKDENSELVILVATSGDTGGAVASGFYDTPGIKVVILYPSGKVSHLQEKQLTTLGKNITALEIDGTFDDCQDLVKQAFLDNELNTRIKLSSANSINIARLIPQSFYYFEALKQVDQSRKTVFSVPSGNFGNLTAGLIAKKMGLPVHHFIAATNINDIVPQYLESGIYSPRPSLATISNAMDVGNPSNFSRIQDIHSSTWNNIIADVKGYSFDDNETREGIKEVYSKYGYTIDPHGAVGYLAFKANQKENKDELQGIILETAHPAKFVNEVEKVLKQKVKIPERLQVLSNREKVSISLSKHFPSFISGLLDSF